MTAWKFGRRAVLGSVLLALILIVSSSLVAATPLLTHARTGGGASTAGPSWGSDRPKYSLTFNESGLPNATGWSVQLFGDTAAWGWFNNTSTNSTIGFSVPNGTYDFAIGTVTTGIGIYVPSPASGSVAVNGTGATVDVAFSTLALYNLTFSETGLPNGSYWSVSLANDSNWWTGNQTPSPLCFGSTYWNSSTNSTVGFTVPDGTYAFAIGNVTTGNGTANGAIYVPAPMMGNVTVNGTNATVDVTFTSLALYDLTFAETGVPSGTNWSAEVYNDSTGWLFNDTANATIGFAVPNGTYNFTIGNVTTNGSMYVPTPAMGNVTVNGTNVTVDVTFASVALYNLTFAETGLPAGTYWFVAVYNNSTGWLFNSTANTTIGFTAPNGTYNFTVGTPFFYPLAGTVTPLWDNGSGNGTGYGAPYVPTPSSGNVSVNGTSVTVGIVFAPVSFYTVTFNETGLPNGTYWSVLLSNDSYWWTGNQTPSPLCFGSAFWNSSTNSTIGFAVPDGTYTFTIWNVTTGNATYVPTPGTGNVTVNGTNLTVDVAFTPLSLYTVTFNETGLPNGTYWSVLLSNGTSWWAGNGTPLPQCFGSTYWNSSTNSTIGFAVPDGTYTFTIWNVTTNESIYVPTPAMGNVTVNGTNVTVDVTFASLALYGLTFTETGLPNGTYWFVELYNSSTGWLFNSTANTTIGFVVPNGTYSFTVRAWTSYWNGGLTPFCSNGSGNRTSFGGGYVATPSSGTVSIYGENVTVAVAFAPLSFYTVTFNETGLPNGTYWWVELGGGSYGGHGSPGTGTPLSPLCGGSPNGTFGPARNGTTIAFSLPNGVYNFTIGNVTSNNTTYVPTPAEGSVTVNGTNVTVNVTFAAGGDPPTGGHASSSQAAPRLGTTSPALGMTVWAAGGVALLAILIGALALAWHRRPGRPGTRNGNP